MLYKIDPNQPAKSRGQPQVSRVSGRQDTTRALEYVKNKIVRSAYGHSFRAFTALHFKMNVLNQERGSCLLPCTKSQAPQLMGETPRLRFARQHERPCCLHAWLSRATYYRITKSGSDASSAAASRASLPLVSLPATSKCQIQRKKPF